MLFFGYSLSTLSRSLFQLHGKRDIYGRGRDGERGEGKRSRASLNESGSFVHLNPAIVGPPVEFVNHKRGHNIVQTRQR